MKGWHRVASDTAATSLQLPGNANGFFRYRVLAKNAYGGRAWSNESSDVQVELVPAGPPVSPVFRNAEAAPTTIRSPKFPANVTVEWDSVARASRYDITIVEPNVLYTTTNIRQSVGINQAGTYYVSVRACNDAGCSDWSRLGGRSLCICPAAPVVVARSCSPSRQAKRRVPIRQVSHEATTEGNLTHAWTKRALRVAVMSHHVHRTPGQRTTYPTTLGNVDGASGDGTGAVTLRGWACWKGYTLTLTSPQVDRLCRR